MARLALEENQTSTMSTSGYARSHFEVHFEYVPSECHVCGVHWCMYIPTHSHTFRVGGKFQWSKVCAVCTTAFPVAALCKSDKECGCDRRAPNAPLAKNNDLPWWEEMEVIYKRSRPRVLEAKDIYADEAAATQHNIDRLHERTAYSAVAGVYTHRQFVLFVIY